MSAKVLAITQTDTPVIPFKTKADDKGEYVSTMQKSDALATPKILIAKRPDPESEIIVHHSSNGGRCETVVLRLKDLSQMDRQAGLLDSQQYLRDILATEEELVRLPSAVEVSWLGSKASY